MPAGDHFGLLLAGVAASGIAGIACCVFPNTPPPPPPPPPVPEREPVVSGAKDEEIKAELAIGETAI